MLGAVDDSLSVGNRVGVISRVAAGSDVDGDRLELSDGGFAHFSFKSDREGDVGFHRLAAIDGIGESGALAAFLHLIDAFEGDFGGIAREGSRFEIGNFHEGGAWF